MLFYIFYKFSQKSRYRFVVYFHIVKIVKAINHVTAVVLDKTLKGGERLDNRKVLRAPGPSLGSNTLSVFFVVQ